ncbi:ATP-binding protein [Tardiphaga sp. 839_C3_N1_4]|uniref:ATP-binding protein n=1 Tax=Tardiphaga sp. 839_C3_N1_4 TaxID=3240761 RepID=UPI003F28C365
MTWNEKSTHDRLTHIGRFVAQTSNLLDAKAVLQRLYRNFRVSQQAGCAFIVGRTGAGKSTVANDFLEDIREEYRGTLKNGDDLKIADNQDYSHTMSVTFEKPGHGLVRPVLKVEVQASTRRDLFRDVLLAIGIRVGSRTTFGQMMAIARHQINEQDIRLIIFDDCHHIAEGDMTKALHAANVIKCLIKQARVQVACMGVLHAGDLPLVNDELESLKDENHPMRPFDLDLGGESEYMDFLAALSDWMPFDRKLAFDDDAVAMGLFKASDGYVGTLTKFVTKAAEVTIDSGADMMTMEHLATAYARKTNAPTWENPFENQTLDIQGFRAAKAERRRTQLNEAARGQNERAARKRNTLSKKLA